MNLPPKKYIVLFLTILGILAFFVLPKIGYFKPNPVIVKTEQESFRTISVWVKNKSPFSGDIVIIVNFYDKKPTNPLIKPIAAKYEYVHIKGNELKKIEILIPVNAINFKYYKVQVARVEFY